LRRDKHAWADGKATEAELALQKGQLNDAFANFRNLKASFFHISTLILDNNGNLVSDKGKLARWNECYSQLFNCQPVPPSMELEDEAKVLNLTRLLTAVTFQWQKKLQQHSEG